MELHQIRYFLAICKEGNFTRAARQCGVKQPSLTRAIQRLESEFGAVLFVRTRTGATLSALGRRLQPHLRRIADSADRAKATAARTASRRAERLLAANARSA
jgi:LysR family transcriptional regulator, hydrogen peroxide-inducible genes activator